MLLDMLFMSYDERDLSHENIRKGSDLLALILCKHVYSFD
jgi:hypothetical protein